MKPNTIWYADGLRWIGSLFQGAATHLERSAATAADSNPQYRPIDEYVSEVRHRVSIHF